MTLDEAKRKIKELSDIQMELFDKTYDRKIYGEARAYEEAGHILDEVDTEPVGNPDKLTLTELAHELRKLFDFRYLTVHKNWCRRPAICMWSSEPRYICPNDIGGWTKAHCVGSLEKDYTKMYLDLSEYKDADGNIDYSKCIVEVE